LSKWLDQVPEEESPALTPARIAKEGERHMLDNKKVQSKVWRPKHKADGTKDDKPHADINMVVFLPKEFMAPVDLKSSMKNFAWIS
jgi:hypothetical protein